MICGFFFFCLMLACLDFCILMSTAVILMDFYFVFKKAVTLFPVAKTRNYTHRFIIMCDYSLFYKSGNNPCENGYSVNVSAIPELYSTLRVDCACRCGDAFTAASDYFDMRLLEVNASFVLSESCPLQVVSITIVWSIVLASCVFGILGNMARYYYLAKKYNILLLASFNFGLFAHLLGVFIIMVISILKLQANAQYVLGTNIPVTISFVLGLALTISGYHVPYYYLEKFWITATMGEFVSPERAKKNFRKKQQFILLSQVVFMLIYVPSFIMLAAPKNGTRTSPTLINLRSAFLALGINYSVYVMFEAFVSRRIAAKLVNKLEKIRLEQNVPVHPAVLELAVLSKQNSTRLLLVTIIVCVQYCIFFIPFLYPMQVYMFLIGAFMTGDVKAICGMFVITKTINELSENREVKKRNSNNNNNNNNNEKSPAFRSTLVDANHSLDGNNSIAQIRQMTQLYEKYKQGRLGGNVTYIDEEVQHNNSIVMQ